MMKVKFREIPWWLKIPVLTVWGLIIIYGLAFIFGMIVGVMGVFS